MSDNTSQLKQNEQEVPNHVNTSAEAAKPNQPDIESAKAALSKLPILGPALWLYARDPMKKFTFIADLDWAILPAVILDQCRLYTRSDIPFAFFTWARVNDAIDQRLRSGVPRIAPHEWQSGPHLWLIDIVTPFGQTDEMIAELAKAQFPGQKFAALQPDPQQGGQLKLREWAAQ
ncbi:MAG: toxin-activating lysine-acyltransferase [Gallionella sp.]|nr:MAG: toxin-activating lysine-acyltransferase [Gallionella sp.]